MKYCIDKTSYVILFHEGCQTSCGQYWCNSNQFRGHHIYWCYYLYFLSDNNYYNIPWFKVSDILNIINVCWTKLYHPSSRKLLKRTQGKTLINMSLSLIGMYATYLAAGNASSILKLNGGDIFCGFLGALLYYFMLVYFIWTAIEAVDLYRKLVKVFHKGGRFVSYCTIIAWGKLERVDAYSR